MKFRVVDRISNGCNGSVVSLFLRDTGREERVIMMTEDKTGFVAHLKTENGAWQRGDGLVVEATPEEEFRVQLLKGEAVVAERVF